MIHPGLCSLTLPSLSPEQIISLCNDTGLTHIEWWGKDHVPKGNLTTAATVARLIREAGLFISSYGSYYHSGVSDAQGLAFTDVLKTAVALEAPAIRIWVGGKSSAKHSQSERKSVINDTLRAADLAAAEGIHLITEYHGNTLTDDDKSTAEFFKECEHPNVFSGWQPRTGVSTSENINGLNQVIARLASLHVFHWELDEDGKNIRLPLSAGKDCWIEYLHLASSENRNIPALMEFTCDNSIEQFQADAKVLTGLLEEINAKAEG